MTWFYQVAAVPVGSVCFEGPAPCWRMLLPCMGGWVLGSKIAQKSDAIRRGKDRSKNKKTISKDQCNRMLYVFLRPSSNACISKWPKQLKCHQFTRYFSARIMFYNCIPLTVALKGLFNSI